MAGRHDLDRAVQHAREGERLHAEGRPASAIREFEEALRWCPGAAPVLHLIAIARLNLGHVTAALKAAYQAHRAAPAAPAIQSNLLLTLLYAPKIEPEAVFDACRQWGEQFAPPSTVPKGPRRGRIRVGYLSGNFCTNAEVFFFEPILRGHDVERFEIFCYSAAQNPDNWTTKFQGLAEHWSDIGALPDEAAAERIRGDALDILVDCSGHFASGRVRVLALKPAPIQVSLGTYPSTTGLRAVDYRITDDFADPPGLTEHLNAEELFRLPRPYCCYRPPEDSPETGAVPAARNGFVTFGSFNRFEKINSAVIDLWSRVLLQVPESRILFHHVFNGRSEAPEEYCLPLIRAFGKRGIDSSRLLFAGARLIPEHLALFNEIDISLDPFPYNGMTTTCESLWMGVPVVTLAGGHHVGRVGVSLLNAAGLADWIAPTCEEYVRIAVSRAKHVSDLVRLRSTLRGTLRRSALLDHTAYAKALECAYVSMLDRAKG